jgi:hypothetical protein
MNIVNKSLREGGSSAKFVLLEGFFNTDMLENSRDQLTFRAIDELLRIENQIGEVVATISLQTQAQSTEFTVDQWEKFDQT